MPPKTFCVRDRFQRRSPEVESGVMDEIFMTREFQTDRASTRVPPMSRAPLSLPVASEAAHDQTQSRDRPIMSIPVLGMTSEDVVRSSGSVELIELRRPGVMLASLIAEVRQQDIGQFSGTIDPAVAQRWLRSIDRVMADMGLDDRIKLRVATRFLDGSAATWWETMEARALVPPDWGVFSRGFEFMYCITSESIERMMDAERAVQLARTRSDASSHGVIPADRRSRGRLLSGESSRRGEDVRTFLLRGQYCQGRDASALESTAESRWYYDSRYVRPLRVHRDERYGLRICYQCGQVGHIRRQCPVVRRLRGSESTMQGQQQVLRLPQYSSQLSDGETVRSVVGSSSTAEYDHGSQRHVTVRRRV